MITGNGYAGQIGLPAVGAREPYKGGRFRRTIATKG